ncbi:hypothetical protein C8J56DRAFT_906241 [Mycena floridula]|nr:hypothetical protein C8J56DRAFT_906241 [Mycena floridula]
MDFLSYMDVSGLNQPLVIGVTVGVGQSLGQGSGHLNIHSFSQLNINGLFIHVDEDGSIRTSIGNIFHEIMQRGSANNSPFGSLAVKILKDIASHPFTCVTICASTSIMHSDPENPQPALAPLIQADAVGRLFSYDFLNLGMLSQFLSTDKVEPKAWPEAGDITVTYDWQMTFPEIAHISFLFLTPSQTELADSSVRGYLLSQTLRAAPSTSPGAVLSSSMLLATSMPLTTSTESITSITPTGDNMTKARYSFVHSALVSAGLDLRLPVTVPDAGPSANITQSWLKYDNIVYVHHLMGFQSQGPVNTEEVVFYGGYSFAMAETLEILGVGVKMLSKHRDTMGWGEKSVLSCKWRCKIPALDEPYHKEILELSLFWGEMKIFWTPVIGPAYIFNPEYTNRAVIKLSPNVIRLHKHNLWWAFGLIKDFQFQGDSIVV